MAWWSLLLVLLSSCVYAATVTVSIPSNVRTFGRWDKSTNRFAWPDTGLALKFSGTLSVKGTFSAVDNSNRLFIRLDNEFGGQTIRLATGTQTVTLASGLSTSSNHTLYILKKTEGCCGIGPIGFSQLVLDGPNPATFPFPPPSHRLMFFGDSHASGHSAECNLDCGDAAYKNANFAYPSVAARMLNAETHTQSWSGIGLVKGYDRKYTMQTAYAQTLENIPLPVWNMSTYIPEVVVVQLGDNDVYTGVTKAQISSALQLFVSTLRQYYPKSSTHIVLAATKGWDFNEVANYIQDVYTTLISQNEDATSLSWLKLPWFSGQQHRVHCEHVSHATLLVEHLGNKLGWASNLGALDDFPCLPGDSSTFDATLRLLVNGNFSRPLTVPAGTGTGNVADGWRSFYSDKFSTAVLLNETGSGSLVGIPKVYFVRLTPKTTSYVGLYQAVEHSPPVQTSEQGLYFKATAEIRSSAPSSTGSINLRIEFKNQAQGLISQADGLKNVTSSFASYSTITGRAPVGTWHVRVVLVAAYMSGVAVDFTNVKLAVSSNPF